MAKEKRRGNREAKKPKAVKAAVDVSPPRMAMGQLTPIAKPKPAK